MANMGFEFDKKPFDFSDNRTCNITYLLSHRGIMYFAFLSNPSAVGVLSNIKIAFTGWTNNPELIRLALEENGVKLNQNQIDETTRQYAMTDEEPIKPSSEVGECEFELFPVKYNSDISLVYEGVYNSRCFFHVANVGFCAYSYGQSLWQPFFLIDAWTGNFTSKIYVGRLRMYKILFLL